MNDLYVQKQIIEFYQKIKKGELSIAEFKDILKLAKSTKLDIQENQKIVKRIKENFYLRNKEILDRKVKKVKEKSKNHNFI